MRPTMNARGGSERDLTLKLRVRKRKSCNHSVRCVNILFSRREKNTTPDEHAV